MKRILCLFSLVIISVALKAPDKEFPILENCNAKESESTLPYYECDDLEKGVYYSLNEFINDDPKRKYKAIEIKPNLGYTYTSGENVHIDGERIKNKERKLIWGYCDGKEAYWKSPKTNYFNKILHFGPLCYTEYRYEASMSSGSGSSASNVETKTAVLDLRTGEFVHFAGSINLDKKMRSMIADNQKLANEFDNDASRSYKYVNYILWYNEQWFKDNR